MSGKQEKTDKLRGMFVTYLLDISWKLAISLLLPFFVAMFVSGGSKLAMLVGIFIGVIISALVIADEVKRINKAVSDV